LVLAGCGAAGSGPTTTLPTGEAVPMSLDGFWLLAASDLTVDIDLGTAAVDGRTNCARLLGSLTFEDQGRRTSFSLPGRDDSRCSPADRARVDDLVELLESVESAEAQPGGYALFDGDTDQIGRLLSGS
jgi:hypothetical protein